MEQKIIDLFDRYTHGGLNRRDFLERLTLLAGSTAAATALLPALENNYAHAEVVAENDPDIVAEMVEIAPGIKGYLVRPKAAGTYPAVLVIHENRGLNPHIKDVTRRVAKEGFIAFGADYLTPLGGTPADEEKAREMPSARPPSMHWPRSRAATARWVQWASAGAEVPSTRWRSPAIRTSRPAFLITACSPRMAWRR